MWPDNETDRDLLNFSGIAGTVAEIIVQASGRPISIGVSGAWGSGKSSMIKLIQRALEERDQDKRFLFVEFNAWLYQGYDDARAALMDVIATRLQDETKERKTGLDKVKDLLKRVKWLRVAKIVATSAAAVAFGVPPVGLVGEVIAVGKEVVAGKRDQATVDATFKVGGEVAKEAGDLLDPESAVTPPREIQALRDSFEAVLDELGVTLVVLIDDLDRCLPETTISTLEAIRLFLFLKNTAFVIAADDNMIKYAVRRHFAGVDDDDLVTSYFDKLIQVPIRVPALGTQEVRAYMLMLFIENAAVPDEAKDQIRAAVAKQLTQSWQGMRVDRAFVQSVEGQIPDELLAQLDSADRLAPLMASASGIVGNPRLVKRFLNALSIRIAIAKAQGVAVDEAVLAKLLLFERAGSAKAFSELVAAASSDDNGIPAFLAPWEAAANKGEDLQLPSEWDSDFVREWLTLPPELGSTDIRGALYVSREQAPLVTARDRLSSDAADVLNALLDHPEMAANVRDRLKGTSRVEINTVMDRILERARRETEWGVPPILEACIVVAQADESQAARLVAFLAERPGEQIRPNIVPKLAGEAWARPILQRWRDDPKVSATVKKAIEVQAK